MCALWGCGHGSRWQRGARAGDRGGLAFGGRPRSLRRDPWPASSSSWACFAHPQALPWAPWAQHLTRGQVQEKVLGGGGAAWIPGMVTRCYLWVSHLCLHPQD